MFVNVPENMILETFPDDNNTYCRSGLVVRVVKERVKKKENNSFCNKHLIHALILWSYHVRATSTKKCPLTEKCGN